MRGKQHRTLIGTVVAVAGLGAAVWPAPTAGNGDSAVLGSDSPSWSRDGRTLAFVGFRSGRAGDVYVIRPDGGGERRLTATKAHEDTPRLSNDGHQVAFVRHVGLTPQVFVMNADGSGERQLTFALEPSFGPTWSPDDRQIAFARGRDSVVGSDALDTDDGVERGATQTTAASDIWVANADGTGEQRLTHSDAIDTQPAWSPDGSTIAFTSDRLGIGAQHVHLMRPDGSNVRKLTDHPVVFHGELRPAWSRDGTKIAFVSEREPPLGNSEIYAVGLDGSNVERVTWNVFHDDWPAWGPGGELAIARGITSMRPEIFVVAADRGLTRKVTGKNLHFVRLSRSPREPLARKPFAVELTVRPAVDPFTDTSCAATIGDQLLPDTQPKNIQGKVRCVWLLPREARGKTLRAIVYAGAGGSEVSRTVARRVR